ncbi:ASTRA complex subunit [Aspergillus nanangensis]|uniref:ASTRA-associated protein 1 n=1 Tax=Aspergillus nanangensis TaxID=2582783 RepID=A0AAD4CY64_ASPNN|nr:ASTRA complex subunit [Aspergillus nanangensis]
MSESTGQQRSPATPAYILRGHAAPIHGLHIFHQNLRLISGDAEGWVIVWDLVIKRPVATWKAHEGAILEVKGFSYEAGAVTEVYTHGRDHKLRMWRFRPQDEKFLHKTLPVDVAEQTEPSSQTQPWLVHSIPVNALNFCAFSILFIDDLEPRIGDWQKGQSPETAAQPSPPEKPLSVLVAVPNALNSGAIDLFHLPSERRICTIPADATTKTGMVMAVKLILSGEGELYVASAYEDGHVMVFARRGAVKEQEFAGGAGKTGAWKWEKLYACRPHSQPVLSIDILPAGDYFISSSADALLVKHPVPLLGAVGSSMHRLVEEKPLKQAATGHSGQQGLRVRSDGKIFAVGGWDSRVRVYSCKSLKELAVLKWHKDGCYAVAFADVCLVSEEDTGVETRGTDEGDGLVPRRAEEFSLATVQRLRNQKVQSTHWLAAGSKDGKVSLWDIY